MRNAIKTARGHGLWAEGEMARGERVRGARKRKGIGEMETDELEGSRRD